MFFSIFKTLCNALFSFLPPKKNENALIIYKGFAKVFFRRRLEIQDHCSMLWACKLH